MRQARIHRQAQEYFPYPKHVSETSMLAFKLKNNQILQGVSVCQLIRRVCSVPTFIFCVYCGGISSTSFRIYCQIYLRIIEADQPVYLQ